MVTADMVKACYRALLNGEPENAKVVSDRTRLPNLEALLLDFISSLEYQTKLRSPLGQLLTKFTTM